MGRSKKRKKIIFSVTDANDIFQFVKEAKFVVKGSLTNLPVLDYIRFIVDGNKLRLIASNLDLFLTMELQCEEENDQSDFLLLISDLYKIFGGMKGGVVFARGLEDYQINLLFDKEKHTLLRGANPDLEYPDFNFFSMEERSVTLPKDNLWFVQQAMGDNEMRNNMNGLCPVEGYGLVSIDGHRLHVVEAEMTEYGKIYPASFVNEMARIAKLTKHQISFTCRKADKIRNSDTAYFSVVDHKTVWSLYSRMIDSTFPEVDRVIPKNSDIKISLDAKEATRILSRVKKFCCKRDKDGDRIAPLVKMKIELSNMFFIANRLDEIVSELEMDIENLSTVPDSNFVIGANADYMIDALKKETGKVTFGMNENLDPIKIDRSDGSYAIVMPMRIK